MSSLTHHSIFGSDTIYNNPSHSLLNTTLYGKHSHTLLKPIRPIEKEIYSQSDQSRRDLQKHLYWKTLAHFIKAHQTNREEIYKNICIGKHSLTHFIKTNQTNREEIYKNICINFVLLGISWDEKLGISWDENGWRGIYTKPTQSRPKISRSLPWNLY